MICKPVYKNTKFDDIKSLKDAVINGIPNADIIIPIHHNFTKDDYTNIKINSKEDIKNILGKRNIILEVDNKLLPTVLERIHKFDPEIKISYKLSEEILNKIDKSINTDIIKSILKTFGLDLLDKELSDNIKLQKEINEIEKLDIFKDKKYSHIGLPLLSEIPEEVLDIKKNFKRIAKENIEEALEYLNNASKNVLHLFVDALETGEQNATLERIKKEYKEMKKFQDKLEFNGLVAYANSLDKTVKKLIDKPGFFTKLFTKYTFPEIASLFKGKPIISYSYVPTAFESIYTIGVEDNQFVIESLPPILALTRFDVVSDYNKLGYATAYHLTSMLIDEVKNSIISINRVIENILKKMNISIDSYLLSTENKPTVIYLMENDRKVPFYIDNSETGRTNLFNYALDLLQTQKSFLHTLDIPEFFFNVSYRTENGNIFVILHTDEKYNKDLLNYGLLTENNGIITPTEITNALTREYLPIDKYIDLLLDHISKVTNTNITPQNLYLEKEAIKVTLTLENLYTVTVPEIYNTVMGLFGQYATLAQNTNLPAQFIDYLMSTIDKYEKFTNNILNKPKSEVINFYYSSENLEKEIFLLFKNTLIDHAFSIYETKELLPFDKKYIIKEISSSLEEDGVTITDFIKNRIENYVDKVFQFDKDNKIIELPEEELLEEINDFTSLLTSILSNLYKKGNIIHGKVANKLQIELKAPKTYGYSIHLSYLDSVTKLIEDDIYDLYYYYLKYSLRAIKEDDSVIEDIKNIFYSETKKPIYLANRITKDELKVGDKVSFFSVKDKDYQIQSGYYLGQEEHDGESLYKFSNVPIKYIKETTPIYLLSIKLIGTYNDAGDAFEVGTFYKTKITGIIEKLDTIIYRSFLPKQLKHFLSFIIHIPQFSTNILSLFIMGGIFSPLRGFKNYIGANIEILSNSFKNFIKASKTNEEEAFINAPNTGSILSYNMNNSTVLGSINESGSEIDIMVKKSVGDIETKELFKSAMRNIIDFLTRKQKITAYNIKTTNLEEFNNIYKEYVNNRISLFDEYVDFVFTLTGQNLNLRTEQEPISSISESRKRVKEIIKHEIHRIKSAQKLQNRIIYDISVEESFRIINKIIKLYLNHWWHYLFLLPEKNVRVKSAKAKAYMLKGTSINNQTILEREIIKGSNIDNVKYNQAERMMYTYTTLGMIATRLFQYSGKKIAQLIMLIHQIIEQRSFYTLGITNFYKKYTSTIMDKEKVIAQSASGNLTRKILANVGMAGFFKATGMYGYYSVLNPALYAFFSLIENLYKSFDNDPDDPKYEDWIYGLPFGLGITTLLGVLFSDKKLLDQLPDQIKYVLLIFGAMGLLDPDDIKVRGINRLDWFSILSFFQFGKSSIETKDILGVQ